MSVFVEGPLTVGEITITKAPAGASNVTVTHTGAGSYGEPYWSVIPPRTGMCVCGLMSCRVCGLGWYYEQPRTIPQPQPVYVPVPFVFTPDDTANEKRIAELEKRLAEMQRQIDGWKRKNKR
jgi:hypothetical protein